jgi:dienelactone hydrolase
MAEIIVSMHAAHRSGKDVVDGFLSRPMVAKERPAVVRVHGYRGLDDGQRAVTRRFAQEGFVCLSPDLFSNPQNKNAPHREAAAKSVVKTAKWLKRALA